MSDKKIIVLNTVKTSKEALRPPRQPSLLHVNKTSLQTSKKVPVDYLYTDFYKKVSISNTAWYLTVFNMGSGAIGGVLTENTKPIPNCLMYLYQSSSGVLAKQTVSKEDGSFIFTGIATDISYFVVGIHKEHKFNAVVLDEVRIDSRK